MKLVVQIALGVFLGGLASQLAVDAWRSYNEQQERQKLAAEESARNAQASRARELIMRQFQGKIQEDRARHAQAKHGRGQDNKLP